MDISTRLDEAMQLRDNISQSALHRLSGVPQPTINRILKGGGAKGPETNTVRKLSEALRVRFEWLMDGKGPMTQEGTTSQPGWTVLARVDEYEVRMLDLLRQLDERAKDIAEDQIMEIVREHRQHDYRSTESKADRDRHQRTLESKTTHLDPIEPPSEKKRKS